MQKLTQAERHAVRVALVKRLEYLEHEYKGAWKAERIHHLKEGAKKLGLKLRQPY